METSDLKVRTGIPGFDPIISGGLKKGKTIILSGSPGSGKTTFGMQFLYSGVEYFDEPGIFVTLSQSAQDVINDFKSYGWEIQEHIDQGRMLIIDARPFKREAGFIAIDESLYRGEEYPFMHLTQLILSSIKRIGARRIVIDSLTTLGMQYANRFYVRLGLQGMIQALEDKQCTSILVSEGTDYIHPPEEWHVVSGVIFLHYTRKGETMQRAVQVFKMRGIRHSDRIYPIKLDENGIQILHPKLVP